MRRLILSIAALLSITGCSHQYRTGTICLDRVIVTDFKTNDPVEVKQDVVDSIASQLIPEIKERISSRTKMTLDDCGKADYRLDVSIAQVNPVISTNRKQGFFKTWAESMRSFQIGLNADLMDSHRKSLVGCGLEEKRDSLSETLGCLADNMMDEIKYLPGK